MHRIRLAPVLLALGVLVVESCAMFAAPPAAGPGERSPAEPIVIRYWDFQQSALDIQAAQERARQRFEEENPDLRVVVEVFPYPEYRARLLEAIRSGNPPDVATIDQIWMAEFAANRAIVALDGFLGREAQPGLFFPNAWQTGVYRGHVWGVPLSYDVWMQLYYNRDLFRRAGLDPERPPTTWTELYEVGQRLTRPPRQYGLALLGEPGEGVVVSIDAFIYSNGGRVLDAAGTRALIDQPESVEALEFYRKLTEIAPPETGRRGETHAVDLFISGQTAMALLGSWQQDTLRLQAPELDWGVALLPAPAGRKPHGTLGGWNLVLFADSPHQREAFRYIAFLAGREVQLAVNSLTPARRDAGREFIRKRRRGPDVLLYTLEQGLPRPISPAYPRISEIQQQMVQRILTGTPAREAAEQAAVEIDRLLR